MNKFIKPQEKYFKSFINAINDSKNNKEDNELNYSVSNFETFMEEVLKGWENEEYYWLVDGERFLGDMVLRKKPSVEQLVIGGNISYFVSISERNKGYGKMLLEYGIKRAKELELDKIIITCYEDNKYSKRLIEVAGGILVNSFFLKSMDKFLLRYLLQLSK